MKERVVERIQESIRVKQAILDSPPLLDQIEAMAAAVTRAIAQGGKVIFAGNGGSFADSIHLTAEFVSRFLLERNPIAALALGANNSILTAVGNDYSYADVFVRELKALARPGDVFIGISTSGNSQNVLACVDEAPLLGIEVFCLTGATGGLLKERCTCICVPSTETARIQESHIVIGHILCELVESSLYAEAVAMA